ncbi:uncharacterized protein LOC135707601 [Ochlerotatus camptorhynchus]|uniref:uncharacterized protein LOC135707601 n=1 Tax=Ochlerotatus camptorhynchus TaxID=644619 RepID=UPI0031E0E03F
MELLEDKLDDISLTAWEESIATDNEPTFTKMIEFLQRRARILETISINRPHHNQMKSVSQSSALKRPSQPCVSTNAATEALPKAFPLCPACEKQKHSLYDCPAFNSLDPKNRLKVITQKKLCSNCFRSDHFARTCRSKYSCKQCSKRHHSMIHPGPYELNSTITEDNTASRSSIAVTANPGPSNVLTVVSSGPNDGPSSTKAVFQSASVLLTTVVVIVVDAYGQEHVARALLDTGSQPNAISERLCQQLHLSRRSVNVPIAGVDGAVTSAKHEVTAKVRSRVSNFREVLDFQVLRKVTSDTPSVPFNVAELKLPDDLILADPDFGTPRRVDWCCSLLLFLAEWPVPSPKSSVRRNRIWMNCDESREHSQQPTATCHAATVVPVDELLQRFWQIEDVSGSSYSVDEQKCEDFYQETVSRDPSGRYVVRMPKHPECDQMISESKTNALRRLKWLDNRLEKDEELKTQYHAFMDEYISLGHMVPALDDNENSSTSCYLPHHPVVKQSSTTTKVRVVFDSSAKTSTGHSLNDALLVRPVVQHDILDIHLRFRMVMIAVVADAEKMYRQVLMHRADRSLQTILWPPSSSGSVQAYELCTVTYGLAPSSFLATRTLLQLVEDHGSEFPKASKALRKNVYVDDFICGENTIKDAIQLRTELTELLQKGGFRFRKWCSNSLPVLAGLPQSSVKFGPDETIKTLGISWEPEADVFKFYTTIVIDNQTPTKRTIFQLSLNCMTLSESYHPS